MDSSSAVLVSRKALTGTISRPGNRPARRSSTGSRAGRGSRSILFITPMTGVDRPLRRAAIFSSPSTIPRWASARNSTMSVSCSAPKANSTMLRLRREPAWVWMPGVSTKISWAWESVLTPSSRVRVVCGLGVTMASFSPTRVFSSVDLPTLGRPIRAIKPHRYWTGAAVSLTGQLLRFGQNRTD